MITQVTYQRVYRLGQFESERLEAVASIEGGDVDAAWAEAVSTVEHEYACLCAARQPPESGVPKTAPEAEHRFFKRYGDTVGGGNWADVQRYLGIRALKPVTVDDWISAARAVRDRQGQAPPRKMEEVDLPIFPDDDDMNMAELDAAVDAAIAKVQTP